MPEPIPIHDHALRSLRINRSTMERAGSFTSIPGKGGMAIGIVGVTAAGFAHRFAATEPQFWLLIWLAAAVVSVAIAGVTMWWKARRMDNSLTTSAARHFFVSYLAPISAAAVLTLYLMDLRVFDPLPPLWLLAYGSAFISSGAFSVRVVPGMGFCFFALGIASTFVSLPVANMLLGVGFGGLHIIFGFIIARRYGG